ncbi:MAG: hypothetical protein HN370_01525 [Phycisphaerales bacterium]|nr:hypothetical protein [Phycisphaerales bacterium]
MKLFSLTRFRQKMRYHTKKFSQTRFGFGEANALLVAANRNLPVPNIYGHGLLKNRFGNPTLDMILMEHIHHHQTIGTLLNDARGNEEECKALLKRTTPLFVQLFHAGCNNIDMNLGTILLNSDGESKDYLLDFEYSRFHNEPNLTVLMSEAGFFAHRCQKNAALSADLMEWWFADLLTALHITDPAEKQHLKQQFNYYATHKLSRKERMNIQ